MLVDNENLTDERLMKLYQNGDAEAFKVLYVRHSPKIYGFLKKRIKNAETVAEVYQEVFIKIHKSKHLYKKSHPVLPWLFTITKNAIVDDARKIKKTSNQIQIDDLQIAAPTPEAGFKISDIAAQLEQVPLKQRSVIVMRYADEKTFEDIAQVLKTSDTNVRQLLSRGLQRLKQLIKEGDNS